MCDELGKKAIEETAVTVRELGGFLSKYVGGTIEQAMGIVEDKLKYVRWERQVRFISKADEFLKLRGVGGSLKDVQLNFAIPLLQAATLEENNDLQDLWAKLLVNAADANNGNEIRHAFISILKDLTPLDALVLNKIYLSFAPESYEAVWTTNLPELVTPVMPDGENLNPPPDVIVSLANLVRLGLISSSLTYDGVAILSYIRPTILGRTFFSAIS